MKWSNQAANVIEKLRLILILMYISWIEYEYEYKMFAIFDSNIFLYIGKKNLNEENNLKPSMWRSSCAGR